MNKKREKPKYNMGQNSVWLLAMSWRRDKRLILWFGSQAIMTVAIATVGIFLPAVVVGHITGGADFAQLAATIGIFAGTLIILHSSQSFVSQRKHVTATTARCFLNKKMLIKAISVDYANLEIQEYTDAHNKALDQVNSNNCSTEQIYYNFENILANVLGFIVFLALLAVVNPLIMVITVVTALLGAGVREWVNRWEHAHDDERTPASKRVWRTINMAEQTKYAKDLRLFAMTNWIKETYDSALKALYAFNKRVQARRFVADAVTALATFAREGIAYAYLIYAVLQNTITVDEFILLFAAVAGFSGWVGGILTEFAALSMHSLNHNRVRQYLEYPDKFRRTGGAKLPIGSYTLRLENVSFTYSGTTEPVLENINLTIKPGEKLAVVGLNGAGKTTLVKLMTGLYDPTEGKVTLNGIDIKEFNRDEYYSLFTAVFQEFNIIAVSIAQTIAQPLAPGEEVDRARVEQCLRLAGLYEKITELPNGIDTLLVKEVHPDATELSGGETQRLMLARALYKSAPMLILDEPTAALDPIAESDMYNKYNELSGGRTSVYISHRLASTRFCDRIIFVDEKKIIEDGNHDTLMQSGGKYRELFDIQAKYYQEEVLA